MRAKNTERIVPGSLSLVAYSTIRERILKGEYPLGAPLSRRKLAAEFGMSFLPVSEAIQKLETEGLVESWPRVGTRVKIPTEQDLRDSWVIREALETQSARLFSEKASPGERQELRNTAARLDEMEDRAGSEPDNADLQYQVQTLHAGLHTRIAACTGCAALCDLIEQNHVLVFNWLYDVASEHRTPPHWHAQLIEVLAGTDPDAADAAMRRHVRWGQDQVQASIASRFGGKVGSFRVSNKAS